MARRRKSFFAAANKGKSGKTLLHNMMAAGAQRAKSQAKKRKSQKAKSANAAARKAASARKKRLKKAEADASRRHRVIHERSRREAKVRTAARNRANEKELKARLKASEEIKKYRARLKADFERKNLIFCDEVAEKIISKSLGAGITLAKMSKYYLEGKERWINKQSIEVIVREKMSNHLLESDFSQYGNTPDHRKIIETLCDLELPNASAVKRADVLAKYLDKVNSTEKHLRSEAEKRHQKMLKQADENKKIESALIECRKNLSMFPEDLNKLEEYVDDDQGLTLTLDDLKENKLFIEGINNKKSFRKKINKELASLISDFEKVYSLSESFHENGQLERRGNFIAGEEDGLWEYFYENGQLAKRGNFIDGKEDDLWESFHENGQLLVTGNYIDGEEDGLLEIFHENGQLEFRGNFIDGERDGSCESFDENGQLSKRENYKDGVLQDPGDGQTEDENDDDGQTEEIKNGLYESFHENGQLSKRENYKDGVLQDPGDGQAEDTSTETTEVAPKGKNAPVTAELTEKITVTLSRNHKTFKTESGDYRLERYKDNKIRVLKDDEICSNTKNVLRAINKEYKLGFTSGDFKKMHTTKLGKEIIEQMKTRSGSGP